MAENNATYTIENADTWLEDLLERLNAHFERVVDWFEESDIDWTQGGDHPGGYTLNDLLDVAPAWAWQGFWEMGWPEDLVIMPSLRGGGFLTAEDLALDRIASDFRDKFHLGGCSPEELEEAEADGDLPPFPALPI